jgi:hypothetical protein
MPPSDPGHPPLPPAILDIEASGFGLGSYPIEVGFVTSDGEPWCSLVRPEPDWQHWDPQAESVHGITREHLLQHGRSSCEIAQALNERLNGLTIYSDAWAHDYTWLNRLFDVADMRPHFKLDNLRVLLTDAQAAIWHDVKRSVFESLNMQRHRASADARLLQQTFVAMQLADRAAA